MGRSRQILSGKGWEIAHYRRDRNACFGGNIVAYATGTTAETPYTEVAYGYSIGEQEQRHIHIGKGAKNDEVEFYLHLVEGGIQDTDVTIRGFARLDGNRFRYKEKGYEFEVAVYNRFITVKTITGDLDGVKADGVYPTTLEMSYYVNPDAFDNYD